MRSFYNIITKQYSWVKFCVRDRSEKPTARNERGLVADSPTRRDTPKTKNSSSNRQYLINKIPTLGVGYDLQSIEIEKNKRYIEVKTTKSRKAINNNRFKLTPNEWDTAETLGDNYFVYYLVINDDGKNIFVIQNPIKQFELGNIKVDKNLVVEFSKTSGQWHRLLEIAN